MTKESKIKKTTAPTTPPITFPLLFGMVEEGTGGGTGRGSPLATRRDDTPIKKRRSVACI